MTQCPYNDRVDGDLSLPGQGSPAGAPAVVLTTTATSHLQVRTTYGALQ